MGIIPKLNRFDLYMIVISLIIGMGIFATPYEVANHTDNVYLYFAVWIFGGAVSLCGALTFAEIGSRYPNTGGFYKVVSYCFNPAFAFMINWVLVISNAASVAAVALIGAEYIDPLVMPPGLQNTLGVRILTVSSVLILYIINYIGIKMSARTQNVLTIFKVLMILILCAAVFKSDATLPAVQVLQHPVSNLTGLGLSLVAVFFTYGGYQQTINFGGDIINPKKNIPKAIFWGVLTVVILYLLINLCYIKVLGLGGLQSDHVIAAKLAGVLFGVTGYKITSILMFASVLAYINVNIMANPRVYYAMAEDGILPQLFKRVNGKNQVQEFGLTFFVGAILLILLFVSSFQKMLDYVMFFDTIGLSIAASSIFILRKKAKQHNTQGVYKVRLFPLVPLIFIASYLFVTINIFINNPLAAIVCFCTFVAGLIIYYLTKRNQKPIPKP
ncbi:amino acid permease [Mucilaginibacter gynuensis]|uniref:Amino acid permease n=1 Tax=Mucilaginibacter gynuensis TaxID=1302236 RepID=A0ABP8GA41_9SPHI